MAEDNLIDFAAQRRRYNRREANVATALGEAGQIQTELNASLMRAECAALAGFDTSDFLTETRAQMAKLSAQLAFAEALAARAKRVRA